MEPNLRRLGVGVGARTFGAAIYNPFLALFLQSVLHVGFVEIGVIFVAVGVAQLPFSMVGGLLTDRWGRRRLIVIGLAGEAAATFALAYAFGLGSLALAIAAGTLGGLVTTAAAPASSAYVADFAEGPERTRGFTWLRIGYNAGYSAGVTLGGFLVAVLDFARSVAIAGGVIAAVAALLALTLGPSPWDRFLEQRDPGPGPLASRVDRPSPPARSLRESLRILARDRPALEVLLAVLFTGVVVGQWPVTYPLYVHDVLGVSYALLGIGLALNGLVVVFGQHWTTESVLGWRHTTIAIVGTVLYVGAYIVLGVAGLVGALPILLFFVSVFVLTLGENLVTIPQATLPSNLAPAGETGSYNGAFILFGGVGFLIAVFVGGLVLGAGLNPLLVWALLVTPAVPAVVLFRDAARRVPRSQDTA